ncbi:MAG: 6-carboxytetrahydropterin synthase QueD [Phycisphaeraceae bacterium]|nr:6-carboxytetrahydropterin synthase QueD [Phycisphaeraceae bacterium]
MDVFREFRFEAAHWLPHVPEGHKCRRMHGHGYRVVVHVTGSPDPHTGWVIDFADIKRAVDPVIDSLDHRTLNDIPGLENSTCENLTRWLWARIKPALPGLSRIVVWETAHAGCEYRGD